MLRKFFLISLACFFLAAPTALAQAKMVSVDADMINLRSGPGSKYKVLWELGRGYPLKVIGSKGRWYRVVDFENDKGWVYKKLVGRTPHLVVNRRAVNLRSKPTTKSKIVRQAKRGVVLRTIQRKRGWVKVSHDDENVEGWIKRDLLWGW